MEQFDGIKFANLEKRITFWKKYKWLKLTQEQMFK